MKLVTGIWNNMEPRDVWLLWKWNRLFFIYKWECRVIVVTVRITVDNILYGATITRQIKLLDETKTCLGWIFALRYKGWCSMRRLMPQCVFWVLISGIDKKQSAFLFRSSRRWHGMTRDSFIFSYSFLEQIDTNKNWHNYYFKEVIKLELKRNRELRSEQCFT